MPCRTRGSLRLKTLKRIANRLSKRKSWRISCVQRVHGYGLLGLHLRGGKTDPHAAVVNVERYRSLLPNCPMVFAVENSRQPATFTLDLAVRGGALLTYDEANTYRDDGTTVNSPGEFWSAVRMEDLTSVHFQAGKRQTVFYHRLGTGMSILQRLASV